MSTVIIRIKNGKAKVVADGTKVSCDAAHAIEKALGVVTKSTPTGTHEVDVTATQVQKGS